MKKILIYIGILTILVLVPFIVGAESLITLENPLKYDKIEDIIVAITNFIAVIGSGIAVLMIIWAGIVYMTAGSDEEKTRNAKKTIQWALIGLAIIWSADFIIRIIQEIIGKK